jgi:hypothetical protein
VARKPAKAATASEAEAQDRLSKAVKLSRSYGRRTLVKRELVLMCSVPDAMASDLS